MKKKPQNRKLPNILITGTPGTGKTTLCKMVVKEYSKMKHYEISEIAVKNNLVEGKDLERNTFIIDDDKVCDFLEKQGVDKKGDLGGHIVDYHSGGYFAERYFDLVIVLRSKIENIATRLKKREYKKEKIQENLQCEIMQVCLDEALESYDNKIVTSFENNTFQELKNNVKKILVLIKQWESKH